MKFLIGPLIKKKLVCVVFISFFCVLSPTQTHLQEPKDTNLSELPHVEEVRANSITFSGELEYGFTLGVCVEVVDQETEQRIAQAQITQITPEKITATILNLRFSRVDMGDFIRLPAKIITANPNWVEIDQGIRQGLTEGTTFKIFRVSAAVEPELEGKKDLPQKIAVSRAVLIDVRQEDATARVIGKRTVQPIVGDFVQIEAYTTINQKSGNIVYLDVASDLMAGLSEGMLVYVFQKNIVFFCIGKADKTNWQQHPSWLRPSPWQ